MCIHPVVLRQWISRRVPATSTHNSGRIVEGVDFHMVRVIIRGELVGLRVLDCC
jgi:hypothetical protein